MLNLKNSLKNKRAKKIILAGLISTSLSLALSLNRFPVKAQGLSLSLYPPILEVMIQPGRTITQVYKLANNGESDLAMTSEVLFFKPQGELGNTSFDLVTQPPQALEWFSFQNTDLLKGQNFLLKKGFEQEVVLKIRVPESASEGDYYLTLLFSSLPGSTLGSQSTTQAQGKIGANILLTVSQSGQPTKKAIIEEFSFPKIIDSFDQPQFKLRVKNTGRAFFKPLGKITITGWLGQDFSLNLLPENVLKDSIRQIRCEADDQPVPCQAKTRFLVGPFKAQVEFGLDKESTDYQKEITFLAFPWKFLTGTAMAVFILVIVKNKLRT